MLFLYRPESPFMESMRFLTQVLTHKDGSEQRQCMRTGPRTEYSSNFIIEDGTDRATIENLLFGGLPSTWTVPAWPEVSFLATAAVVGATSISTDHSLCDFRPGQQAVLYQDEQTYEVLTAITLSGGAIGFTTPLANNWPVGTEVYPLRDCIVSGPVRSKRYPSNATEYSFQFGVLDASVNLFTGVLPTGSSLTFSTMGFGTDSAVLVLSDPNAMASSLSEVSDANLTILDSSTGPFSNFTYWTQARRSTQKAFVTHTRQDLWAVRVLLHSLKGQQQSFFLPVFSKDVVPNAGLTIGTSTMTVVNNGFTVYVSGKARKYVRVEFADGTHVDNVISSAVVNSSAQETLTFLDTWPATVPLANILRVTFYEKVRIANDDININHVSLNGEATVQFAVKAVIE